MGTNGRVIRTPRQDVDRSGNNTGWYFFHLRPLYADILFIVGVIFLFTRSWLPGGFPGEDFPGNVSLTWYFKDVIVREGNVGYWSSYWFNGFSLTLLKGKFFAYLPSILLSYFMSEIMAVKLSMIFFHVLAGLTMYWLVYYLVKNRESAVLASICYSIHPVYIMETAQRGHLEVSMFYAFVPLSFLVLINALRRWRWGSTLVAGITFATMFHVNNEGSFAISPFIFLIIIYETWHRIRHCKNLHGSDTKLNTNPFITHIIKQNIKVIITVCIIFLGLGMYFILPALDEISEYNLFDKEYINNSIDEFALKNPLYLIDRNGLITGFSSSRLPDDLKVFKSIFYVGIVAIILFLLSATFKEARGYFIVFTVMGLGSYLLSLGPYSLVQIFYRVFKHILNNPFLSALVVVILGIGTWKFFEVLLCNIITPRICRYSLSLILTLMILFLKPFLILRTLAPHFQNMRSPQWFFISMGPLAISAMASYFFPAIRKRVNPMTYYIIFVTCVSLIIIDFIPYKDIFARTIPGRDFKDLKRAFLKIREDTEPFRTLAIESYHPFSDLGVMYSGKPSSWYWLNWSSPYRTGTYVLDWLYAFLWHGDMDKGLELAGIANIKYIVDDRKEPPSVIPSGDLKRVYRGTRFTVYKNIKTNQFVHPYSKLALYVGPSDGNLFSLIAFLNPLGVGVVQNDKFQDSSKEYIYDYYFWNLPQPIPKKLTNDKTRVFDMYHREKFSMQKLLPENVKISWQRPREDEIIISVNTRSPIVIQVAESYYPYWNVTVDYNRQKIFPLNFAFMGLKLDPGEHKIHFKFKPPFLYAVGKIISLITLITLIFISVREHRSKRKYLENPPPEIVEHINNETSSIEPEYVAWKLKTKPVYIQKLLKDEIRPSHTVFSKRVYTSSLPPLKLKQVVIASLIFLIGTGLYLKTVSPNVAIKDSGELIAAAYTLGSPHPPGYPTLCLLGKLLSLIIPFANIAFKVNLVLSLSAAGCCSLIYLIASHVLRNGFAGVMGAYFLMGSKTFWSQAVITEKYTLMALFLLVCLYLVLLWGTCNRRSYLYLFFFFWGISITTHYIMTTFFLGFITYILWNDPWFLRRFKTIVTVIALVLLGLSINLYLPIRSSNDPYMNWGNPSNLDRFIYHVQRGQYKNLEFSEKTNIKTKLQFINNFAYEFQEQFAPLILIFSMAGLIGIARKHRKLSFLTVSIFLLNTVFLIFLIKFPFKRENILRFKVYYIPAYVIAALWMGIGISGLRGIIGRITPGIGSYILLLMPVYTIMYNYYPNDRSNYYLALDYVKNIFSDIKHNGIMFPSADFQTFPMAYLQCAERFREDVLLADMYGSLHENVVREYFENVAKGSGALNRDELLVNLTKGSKRPIYFGSKDNVPRADGYRLRTSGLIFQAFKENVSLEYNGDQNKYITRGVNDPRVFKESMGRSIVSSYPYFRGQYYLEKGDIKKALSEFEETLELDPDVAETCNNIGSSLAEQGYAEEAITFFKKAIELYEGYALPRFNLAKIYRGKNMPELALKYYGEAILKDPDNQVFKNEQEEYARMLGLAVEEEFADIDPITLNNWGSRLAEEGKMDEAEKMFLNAMKRDPGYSLPLKNLGTLYLQQKKYENALELFKEYLKRFPDAEDHEVIKNKLIDIKRILARNMK